MESKLKALKVADLKALLTTAGTPAPKAAKADLITRILASPLALEAYRTQYESGQAEVVSEAAQESTLPAESVETAEPEVANPPAADASLTSAPPASSAEETVDPELEKRRQRAERFGIPLVEPKAKARKGKKAEVEEDPEKLDARAARFGTNAASTKRKLDEPVDEAEAERRRKRAERFGTGAK